MRNRFKNKSHEINAGSMADVAFLLLIFFLVSTSITQLGSVAMPIKAQNDGPSLKTKASSTLMLHLNAQNTVMADHDLIEENKIPMLVADLILKNTSRPCHIGIQYHPKAAYQHFANIHAAIRSGLDLAADQLAEQKYGLRMHQLKTEEQQKIAKSIQLNMYESEFTTTHLN